jgi:ABC-type Fe3+-hydroxamate transport system substrate-binding protein
MIDLAGLTDPELAALPGGHTSKHIDAAMLLARDPDVILLYWRRVNGEPVYARELEARLGASELLASHYEVRAILPSYGDDDAGYTVLAKRTP